jgi:2-polyprenyl-3-methyl-5-hydroxy-6-metoxy-1,4-benzoquinol methylase
MNCKICNKKTKNHFDSQMQWDFYYCKECEFFFKDSKHYLESEEEKKVYNNHNNTIEAPGYVEMFEVFMQNTFKPYLKSIKNVLEFGCGPGPVLATLLEQKGLHVSRYDKFYFPQKVYENSKYDLITSTEVLEHIDKPLEIFDFFYKHICDGGYLAIMTQFHPNSPELFFKWWYRRDPTHICFFRLKTFEVLAKKSGFKIISCDEKKSILLQKDI